MNRREALKLGVFAPLVAALETKPDKQQHQHGPTLGTSYRPCRFAIEIEDGTVYTGYVEDASIAFQQDLVDAEPDEGWRVLVPGKRSIHVSLSGHVTSPVITR